MRYSKILSFITIMLMIFPMGVYANMDHSGHDMSSNNPSFEKQSHNTPDKSHSNNEHNLNVTDSQHDTQAGTIPAAHGQGYDSSGHGDGGEAKKTVLEPMKNEIVAGFLGLNVIILVVAWIIKKKNHWGG